MSPSLILPPRAIAAALLLAASARGVAQDTTPAVAPGVSATASATPAESGTAALPYTGTPSATPSPAASPGPGATPFEPIRKVTAKLQFLPPPMEGTISLGIYNESGKLVRVLHRYAAGGEFVAALDGYITKWDGLDDSGQPAAPGRYSARGYTVGAVTVRPAPMTSASTGSSAAAGTLDAALPALTFPNGKPLTPQSKIRVGLVANPLERDRAGSAELAAGFDGKGSWLALANGLPLKQVSTTPGLKWAAIGRSAPGEPILFVQGDGAKVEAFSITKIADMMAFDCGSFDLPAR